MKKQGDLTTDDLNHAITEQEQHNTVDKNIPGLSHPTCAIVPEKVTNTNISKNILNKQTREILNDKIKILETECESKDAEIKALEKNITEKDKELKSYKKTVEQPLSLIKTQQTSEDNLKSLLADHTKKIELLNTQLEKHKTEDDRICIICYENLPNQNSKVLYPCGHCGFCDDCVTAIQKATNTCPCCRASIKDSIFNYKTN